MERALDLVACCRPLDEGSFADDEAQAAAQMFKALADPARVRLVNLLATSDEPVCACELIPSMSLAQPTVSHHLKKLTDAGLLEREQRGKWAYFTLNREALRRLADIIQLEEVPV
jgi:ArsR family transcriptional regulator, arsenate/arsenite/antimonite-responsive transcriptional repressor